MNIKKFPLLSEILEHGNMKQDSHVKKKKTN